MHDFRLVPAALTAWTSTWLVVIVGRTIDAPWLVAGVVVAAAVSVPLLARARLGLVVATIAVVIGLLAPPIAALRVHQMSTSPVAKAAEVGGFISGTATLTSDPVRHASGVYAYARLSQVTFRAQRTRGLTPVKLSLTADALELLPGTTLEISGIAHGARLGERAAAVIEVIELQVNETAPTHQKIAGELRAGLRQAVQGRPDDAAALLPSLAIGDTSLVNESLKKAMRDSGLSHLTVVSGANVTIVLLAVFVPLTLLHVTIRARAVVAFLVLVGFVVVARPDPSVLRAAVMGSIALIALWKGLARNLSGGSHRSLAALSSAIVVLVLWDPWLATSWGFALSVAATAGLVMGARPLSAALRRKVPQRLGYLSDALAVTVAAQVAVAPLLIVMGGAVSVISIPANVLAAPAVAPATMSGLSAAVVSPLSPTLASWIALPGTWATGWIAGIARKAQSIDVPHSPSWIPRDAAVVMCDVGQGASVVVRGTDDHAVVFDVGPDPDKVDDCLDRLGVRVVDLLILTHFHADHVDGLAGLLRGRTVGRLVISPLLSPREKVEAVTAAGVPSAIAGTGQVWTWRDVRIDVLWPGEWLDSPSPENDHSVVCVVTMKDIQILLTGDIELAAQRILAPSLTAVDVMTMPHHGSAKQSARFARAVHPKIVLIPVGRHNEYGHPHQDAIDLYASMGSVVGRTDLHGTLAVVVRGGEPVLLAKP